MGVVRYIYFIIIRQLLVSSESEQTNVNRYFSRIDAPKPHDIIRTRYPALPGAPGPPAPARLPANIYNIINSGILIKVSSYDHTVAGSTPR